MGGLSRKAALLKQLTIKDHESILALDAGALLFKQPQIPQSQLPALRAEADGIIKSYVNMGYRASGIALQDLAGGLDYLIQAREKTDFTWLSMNLAGATDKNPLFQPFIITKVGGASVAVLGLTAPTFNINNSNQGSKRYQILPWHDVLADTLAQVKERSEMVILLSSYPYSVNEKIARQFHEINIIIQSGYSKTNLPPKKVENTLICQTGGEGKYVGKMDIHWNKAREWQNDFSLQLKNTHNRLDRTTWQIQRMERRYSRDQLTSNNQYKKLQTDEDNLKKEMDRLDNLQKQKGTDFCTYTNSFIGMRMSIAEDPEVRAIVEQTTVTANQINRNKLALLREQQTKKPNNVNQPGQNIPTPMMTTLAGRQVCQKCHPQQTKFWQKTRHAKAWQTLAKVNQQFNQNCLICHVTLPTYDKKTVEAGHLLDRLVPAFNHVGCESCHGPGQQHAVQPKLIKLRKPDQTTCLICHTGEHDNTFDFKRKVVKIHCPPSAQP